jgi:hypothetical protein
MNLGTMWTHDGHNVIYYIPSNQRIQPLHNDITRDNRHRIRYRTANAAKRQFLRLEVLARERGELYGGHIETANLDLYIGLCDVSRVLL